MGSSPKLSPGDEWPAHYRGFKLQVSPNGDVWWQLYNGTDRLQLSDPPEEIVEETLALKRIGGRVHITEDGDVLTRLEDDGDQDSYTGVYVGSTQLQGQLVPEEDTEFAIEISPDGLSPGDLWPSVYDGSRYSFAGDRVWWHNGSTNRRHPVSSDLPAELLNTLQRFKQKGGSFRITPAGDVITLVPSHPTPEKAERQFSDLPRVVQNIIRLRKDRGVEMLPIYVGELTDTPLAVNDPTSLTDEMTDEERESLASWASNLGTTTERSSSNHQAGSSDTGTTGSGADSASGEDSESAEDDDGGPEDPKERLKEFDDDPMEWIQNTAEENRD